MCGKCLNQLLSAFKRVEISLEESDAHGDVRAFCLFQKISFLICGPPSRIS